MSKSNSREIHGSAAPREYHRRSMNLHPLSFATRLAAVVLPLALASVASAQSPLGPGIDAPASRFSGANHRLRRARISMSRPKPATSA